MNLQASARPADRPGELCAELGIAAAHLVLTANGYTDRLRRLRRGKNMTLAAAMQWGILPPLTFSLDGTTVAGLMEPAPTTASTAASLKPGDAVLLCTRAGVLFGTGTGRGAAMPRALGAVATRRPPQ
ncbi:MAG: hypothetical protein ACR2K2_07255 [Mycobacteriales bacterium]